MVIILDKINGSQYFLGDEFCTIEAQKMERRRYVPWAFRANEVLATWIGIQMGITPHVNMLNNQDRVRTPPPAYHADPTPVHKENESSEEYSLCRTICQLSVCLIALAIAIIW